MPESQLIWGLLPVAYSLQPLQVWIISAELIACSEGSIVHAGLAVTVDMMVTTCLVTMVMLLVWRTHVVLALVFFLIFGAIEGALFSATLLKVPHGGW